MITLLFILNKIEASVWKVNSYFPVKGALINVLTIKEKLELLYPLIGGYPAQLKTKFN